VTEIVEVHWNARPHLARLGLKVSGASLDPRADRLFREIREGAAILFPGCVTLVRIATRNKNPNLHLRVSRAGIEQEDVGAIETIITQAVCRAMHPQAEKCD
jgi:hypothetical protein